MSLLISPSAFVYVVNVTDISPAANKFICIVLEPDSQVQFIFKVTTANKPATFASDFSTAQQVSDIII